MARKIFFYYIFRLLKFYNIYLMLNSITTRIIVIENLYAVKFLPGKVSSKCLFLS